jgi:TolB protein
MRTNRSAETLARTGDAGRAATPPRAQFNTSAPPAESQRESEGRHAALIGLYGELLSRPAPANGRFDGAGNRSQITAVTEGACFQPAVDRSGKWLTFASTQHRRTSDVYLKSTTGRTQTRITSDPADDMMPCFAPDGKRIAFASNRYGNWDIFVTTTDAAPPMPITDDTDDELHPTWSPDGRQIAYCKLGAQSGRWEIWVVDLENLAAPRFLEYGLFPEWNPDPARSKLVFQRARERGSRFFSIWTIDYVGGEAMYPTEIISAANAAAMHPSWSSDGTRIVFVTVIDPDGAAERPAQADLWVISDDGTGRTNLTNGQFLNMNPVWSRDGTVYYLSDRSGSDNIWAVATGRTIRLGSDDHGLVTADPDAERGDERP